MDEPVTDIAELQELVQKVLRKEDISPEEYGRVLQFTRKIRREGGRKQTEAKPAKQKKEKFDATQLFATPVKQ